MKKIFAALAALVGALALTLGATAPATAAPRTVYVQNECDTNEIALQFAGKVNGLNTWTATNRSADSRDYLIRFSDGGAWKSTQYATIGAGQTATLSAPYAYVRVYPGDATPTLAGASKAGCSTLTGTSAWASVDTKRGR